MNKLLAIGTILLLATSLFAQNNQQILVIATFPFTGSEITTTKEGESLSDLFISEFIPLGYTFVTQAKELEISSVESGYKTDEIIKIGKQIAADYVLIGSLSIFLDQISLKVEVTGVESSQIVASETRLIKNINEITTALVKDMTESLNSKIKNITVISQKIKSEKDSMQDLKIVSRNKLIGRGAWIGGTAIMGASGIIMITQFASGVRDHLETAGIVFGIGSAFTIGGVVTYIVFGVRENKLLEKLESQGVSFSAVPDFTSDSFQLALKYSF